jgi:uncharacterized membrane protein
MNREKIPNRFQDEILIRYDMVLPKSFSSFGQDKVIHCRHQYRLQLSSPTTLMLIVIAMILTYSYCALVAVPW